MSKDSKPQIKLDKYGRPIVPSAGPVDGPRAGWRGNMGGGNKGPSAPAFTKRRTGVRGDK